MHDFSMVFITLLYNIPFTYIPAGVYFVKSDKLVLLVNEFPTKGTVPGTKLDM